MAWDRLSRVGGFAANLGVFEKTVRAGDEHCTVDPEDTPFVEVHRGIKSFAFSLSNRLLPAGPGP